MAESVLLDWIAGLSFQQQTVLMLALRGPDGVSKDHPCKPLIRAYRASILKQAYSGLPAVVGAPATDSFSSLESMRYDHDWERVQENYFNFVDSLPHHAHLHIMHGGQILSHYHPNELIQRRWRGFYWVCCHDMHVTRETKEEMDKRLNDGGRFSQ